MADNPALITEMIKPFLEPDEQVLGAMNAAPRGRTTAMAGGGLAASMIGSAAVGNVAKKAEAAGLKVGGLMAIVVTNRRLITARIKVSAMGAVTQITEMMSAVPLSNIAEMTAKRMGLGGTLAITPAGGEAIKLECRVNAARDLVDAFNKAKANA
jgi:hypothetical protein